MYWPVGIIMGVKNIKLKKYLKFTRNIFIVLLIIFIVILLVPSICHNYGREEAIRDTMCLKMLDIEKRIKEYKKDNNRYPNNTSGLLSLVQNNENNKSYLKKIPKDFWKTPFQYIKMEKGIKLFSYGKDKKANTNDDIYLSKCKEK